MVQAHLEGSRLMKFQSDIDIDFADRKRILALIEHTPASQQRDGRLVPHNTGVYVTRIPQDPSLGIASLEYESAEDRGYIKLDLLNVNLYQQVQDEQHLLALMQTTPSWSRFNQDQAFFESLIHVNNHWAVLNKMPEPVDSIPRLAMFLAIIRPAKRHLIGRVWKDVAADVWTKPTDDGYYFKQSHAVAYAHLVVVNMNLNDLANQDD
jgi:hypothetical protein